ncbi:BAG family molecular chaperone regulator 1-like, partial [Rhincodon typus]|uniref:BAG family molecular chaperone regulator 1-like n=1 Tax=Rhincodon typus TaxID=259920 RepID=UPI002030407D
WHNLWICTGCAPHNDGVPTRSPPRPRPCIRCGAEVEQALLGGDMSGDAIALTLMHGSSKHKIEISAVQEGCEPTLQDMATVIAQVTGVPQQLQKLIFKGKSLKDMEQPLSVLGVKNGCKIMMIGKK